MADRDRSRGWVLAAVLLLLFQRDAGADEPMSPLGRALGLGLAGDAEDALSVGAGAFDVARERPRRGNPSTSGAGQLEYRNGRKFYFLGPLAGLLVTSDGGVLGYGGLYFEIARSRWTLTPFSTVAGYGRGEGKPLGGILQFHSGITLGYRFGEASRLGATVAHVSNADLLDSNPGAESILLTYTLLLGAN